MRRLWLSLCVVGVISVIGIEPGWSGPYESGIAAYRQGNYPQATQYFKKFLEANGQTGTTNAKAVFYLGLCYAQQKQYNAARSIFDTLLKNEPANSPLAAKARANMAVITQAQLQAGGKPQTASALGAMTAKTVAKTNNDTNYLASAISQGKVVHWNPAKMPLKVFIKDGSTISDWRPEMVGLVREAMGSWQTATRNKVRFITSPNQAQADIVVGWTHAMAHDRVGENPFEAIGNTITRSDVTVAIHTADGRPMPWTGLKQTVLHEMGHAIGIQGHSPFPQDIMYWQVNAQQGQGLTSRDIQTVSMLYDLEADIQNNGTSVAQSKKALESARLGMQQQAINNPKAAIAQYQAALKLDPQQVQVVHLLAQAYRQNGNLPMAESTYRQALQAVPQDKTLKAGLAAAMIDLGVKRYNERQHQNAKAYFQSALSVLEPLSKSTNPPEGTWENIAIVRKNLAGIP
jgi:tetratricopeptide (TPR) repeat protein